jgi:hypothetical protein
MPATITFSSLLDRSAVRYFDLFSLDYDGSSFLNSSLSPKARHRERLSWQVKADSDLLQPEGQEDGAPKSAVAECLRGSAGRKGLLPRACPWVIGQL